MRADIHLHCSLLCDTAATAGNTSSTIFGLSTAGNTVSTIFGLSVGDSKLLDLSIGKTCFSAE
jgi:hypothetical protein